MSRIREIRDLILEVVRKNGFRFRVKEKDDYILITVTDFGIIKLRELSDGGVQITVSVPGIPRSTMIRFTLYGRRQTATAIVSLLTAVFRVRDRLQYREAFLGSRPFLPMQAVTVFEQAVISLRNSLSKRGVLAGIEEEAGRVILKTTMGEFTVAGSGSVIEIERKTDVLVGKVTMPANGNPATVDYVIKKFLHAIFYALRKRI